MHNNSSISNPSTWKQFFDTKHNLSTMKISSKDGSKVMTVIASPGQGPDRSTEVSYTDTKVSE